MFFLVLLKYAVLVALVVFLLGFMFICGYLYRLHAKYSHLPGPTRTSFFLGNLSEMAESASSSSVFVWAEMQKKYGPVFVFFFMHNPFVFIADPPTVKSVLMDDTHPKPPTYSLMHSLYGIRFLGRGLVSETDHARECTTTYLQPCIPPEAGFGIEQEFILEDHPFVGYVESTFKGFTLQIVKPFEWLKPSHWPFRWEVQHATRSLRDTGKNLIIEARRAQPEGRELKKNILSNIMKYFEDEDLIYLETMIDQFITFFVAGQDTTASLLGFTIVELGKHPEIMKRVVNEIDTVIGEKDFVDYEDVIKMEYTLRVLKETLRLYPPAAGTSRKLAHDMNVCGYHIPQGSIIQFVHTTTSRMEEYFKNPLTFDPDRFLREDDKPLYTYYPFSLGSRSCIGQQFALIEARIVLAKLYKNFDLKLDPTQSFDVYDKLTLKPKGECTNWIYTRQR